MNYTAFAKELQYNNNKNMRVKLLALIILAEEMGKSMYPLLSLMHIGYGNREDIGVVELHIKEGKKLYKIKREDEMMKATGKAEVYSDIHGLIKGYMGIRKKKSRRKSRKNSKRSKRKSR